MHGTTVTEAGNRIAAEAASPKVELLIQLLKLSSLISRPMQDGVAAAHDISLNELRIIMCLGGEGALAGHDITQLMAIPPMNVSRALANLLGRGWIEAVIDAGNRRRKPVQLSDSGWVAYNSMIPDVAAVADTLTASLNATTTMSMHRLAEKVIACIETWPPEGSD